MKKAVLIASLSLSLALCAYAEQKHGVEVYPGAKADPAVAKMVADMGIKDAGTYRTADAVAKVAEFYRKQNLKQDNLDAQGAMFSGKGIQLTVQNPWLDMKTGKMMNDTLISIVKQKSR